jgi:formylmethanofuran dehydrogenase subunit E
MDRLTPEEICSYTQMGISGKHKRGDISYRCDVCGEMGWREQVFLVNGWAMCGHGCFGDVSRELRRRGNRDYA